MDAPSHYFFTRSGLAGDQNGGVGGRDFRDHVSDLGDGPADPNEFLMLGQILLPAGKLPI